MGILANKTKAIHTIKVLNLNNVEAVRNILNGVVGIMDDRTSRTAIIRTLDGIIFQVGDLDKIFHIEHFCHDNAFYVTVRLGGEGSTLGLKVLDDTASIDIGVEMSGVRDMIRGCLIGGNRSINIQIIMNVHT